MPFLAWPDSQAVHRMLTDCCLQNEPVTVMSPASGLLSRGEFCRLDSDTVSIRFASDQSPLLSEALCCVTFQYEKRPRSFFTSILGVIDGADETRREVVLALPTDICAAERRAAARLPVAPDAGLSVTLTAADGQRLEGLPIDISVGGLLLESEEDPPLAPQQPVQAELELEGKSVLVPARIARRQGRRCGVAFVSRWADPQAPWRVDLLAVVRQVELAWIRHASRRSRSAGRGALLKL